jgi:hypothetical protein
MARTAKHIITFTNFELINSSSLNHIDLPVPLPTLAFHLRNSFHNQFPFCRTSSPSFITICSSLVPLLCLCAYCLVCCYDLKDALSRLDQAHDCTTFRAGHQTWHTESHHSGNNWPNYFHQQNNHICDPTLQLPTLLVTWQ